MLYIITTVSERVLRNGGWNKIMHKSTLLILVNDGEFHNVNCLKVNLLLLYTFIVYVHGYQQLLHEYL